MRPLAAALVLAVAGVAPAADPTEHVSEKGKYKATFPGTVKPLEQSQKTAAGTIKIGMDVCEVSPKLAFVVSYNDYPDVALKADPQVVLDGVVNGNKGPKGKIVRDKKLEFGPDKAPARDVLIDKGGTFFRNTAVLKGSRLYQVIVVGGEDEVSSKEADAFVKSFEITK